MQVTIFGTGYVGLVTGTCLADAGHHVCCVDIDSVKIDRLNAGEMPIFEPGLAPLVEKNLTSGRLQFSVDAEAAINLSELIFIAVGTPPGEDGSADLSYVLTVARQIAESMTADKIVVTKSTVPVGTAALVKREIDLVLRQREVSFAADVASNPEFLKEGSAVADFMKPDRIVIGSDCPRVQEQMSHLYAPFNRMRDKLVFMDSHSSELTKYAANAMLATKISFMNEMANLAERLGADIEQVRRGIGADPRIGYHFIYPGCGYGGSCFPKDVQAMTRMADQVDYPAELLNAVESVNQRQKLKLFERVIDHFDGPLQGKTFALWGLAFKPNTDDMREAPSRILIERLLHAGARVRAYDPEALLEAQRLLGSRDGLEFCESQEQVLVGADALLICTEWKCFLNPDFEALKSTLNQPLIFDGRNLYDPESLKEMGFTYYAIGRGDSVKCP
ncbi:MAG: UDP-glucose/GDP-mannose dehydrogenase family protein [Halopseudomonas sp.]